MLDLLRWLTLIPLSVLPGAWVSHTLGRGLLHRRQALALALVLSPFVVAMEMLLLRSVAVPFEMAAWLALIGNLPAVLLLRKRDCESGVMAPRKDWSHWIIGILAAGGIVYAAYPWLTVPGYRVFSYHNYLYIDAVYSLSRSQSLVPEEAQMAGYVLAYPWFSQLHTATLGVVSDMAPTFLYCLLNAVQLIALTLCIFSAARDELKLKLPSATLVTTLVFWGQNIPGTIAGFYATGGAYAWAWLLGDLRTGPFLLKFNNANAMPFGLALLSAVVLLALIAGRAGVLRVGILIGVLLAAMGTLYPALLPPAGLLGGVVWMLGTTPLAAGRPRQSRRDLAVFAACLFVAAVISYLYKQIITGELQMAAIWVSDGARMMTKFNLFIVSMILPLIPALLYVMRELKRRQYVLLVLGAFVLLCTGLNIAFSMGGNIEYKFLYGSAIGLALLAGMYVDRYVTLPPRAAAAASGLLAMLLLALYIKHSYGYKALVPGHIQNGPPVVEAGYALDLHESEPDAGWTRWVREHTPVDSVVITHQRVHYVGTYLNRTQYVVEDGDDLKRRIGYGETAKYNLITLRGYPKDIFEHRLGVVSKLYVAQEEEALQQVMEELRAVGRPIVLHFEGDTFARRWFDLHHAKSKIYDRDGHGVWLLTLGH